MDKSITIEAFRLTGFRAFLRSQEFQLRRGDAPLNFAVFAPNAKGKSSLVDAFEFYFSEDATLQRLGARAAERYAGRAALEHVDAQDKGVNPSVQFWFREGTEKFGDCRNVSQKITPLPAAAARVLARCALPFVIRGYEPRRFVEEETSERRYKEIVAWLGLQPLLTIQENLKALRRQVKQRAEDSTKRQERLRDLVRITGNAVTEWDEADICAWLNSSVISKLDKALTLTALSEDEAGYQALKERKAVEDEKIGIASLKRFLTQIEDLYKQPPGDGEGAAGAVPNLGSAVTDFGIAASRESEERVKASQTVFSSVWAAAKSVFENNQIPLEACPVCDTQFPATPHGSRDAIQITLDTKLHGLADYQVAETGLKTARDVLSRANQALAASLENLTSSLKNTGYADKINSVMAYEQALATWKTGHRAPDSAAAVGELIALHRNISEETRRIEEGQGEETYAGALRTVESLIKLKGDLRRIELTKVQLLRLNDRLNEQSHVINTAFVSHTQNLIGELKDKVNELYRGIQGDGTDTPPIRLELPDEEDTNQQRLQLVIDFARNRKGVVPTGYLSDSQIHALALSLRLAAIRLFNGGVPVIVLDDVVTSYDADHRKSIAAMLAKHFSDHQVVLVTHDERFFMLLQDHQPRSTWSFRRIAELKPDFGPAFHDYRTPDEVIQAKLDSGQGAANEIRQAEEEWLLDICRAFRVKVVIRPIDRPYKYERSELASGLASFLKTAGIAPPQVPGIASPFLVSLQKGNVENFGSHFSDNPCEGASSGDEKTRWKEFTYFRDQFACKNCGKKRFVRPDQLKVPVCEKCNRPFSFEPSTPDLSEGQLEVA